MWRFFRHDANIPQPCVTTGEQFIATHLPAYVQWTKAPPAMKAKINIEAQATPAVFAVSLKSSKKIGIDKRQWYSPTPEKASLYAQWRSMSNEAYCHAPWVETKRRVAWRSKKSLQCNVARNTGHSRKVLRYGCDREAAHPATRRWLCPVFRRCP